MKFSMPGSPFQKIWQVYDPGFWSEMVSVTFCMKMRPLSWSRGLPALLTIGLLIFFALLALSSLQQSNIISKR